MVLLLIENVENDGTDREGNSGRWPGYAMSTKAIFNPAEVSFFWRKSVLPDVPMQSPS